MDPDRIHSVSVGGPDRLEGGIEIREYDPFWPVQFAAEAARLFAALGAVAIAIEHTGSTAVPGLAAKPIIDIVLTVADSADEEAYAPTVTSLGYELRVREPDWFEHRMFKLAKPVVNLHVFSNACPEGQNIIQFRDWLRANPPDRELYERTKRQLARRAWGYVQEYADAKSNVIKAIMERAASTR